MKGLLDPAQHARIFDNAVWPDFATEAAKDGRPVAIVTGGQPGAGKGGISAQAWAFFKERGDSFIHVDADELRQYHPDYRQFAEANDLTSAQYVHEDAGKWADELIQAGIEHKTNLLIDQTSKNKESLAKLLDKLQEAGYAVRFDFMAVAPHISEQRIITRYIGMKFAQAEDPQRSPVPRFVPLGVHQAVIDALPESVALANSHTAIEKIRAFDSSGKVAKEWGGYEDRLSADNTLTPQDYLSGVLKQTMTPELLAERVAGLQVAAASLQDPSIDGKLSPGVAPLVYGLLDAATTERDAAILQGQGADRVPENGATAAILAQATKADDLHKQDMATGTVNGIDVANYAAGQIDAMMLQKQAQAQGLLERLDNAEQGVNMALQDLEEHQPGLFSSGAKKSQWRASIEHLQARQETLANRKEAIEEIINEKSYEQSRLRELAEQKVKHTEPEAWRAYDLATRLGAGGSAVYAPPDAHALEQSLTQTAANTQAQGQGMRLALQIKE
jgi:tRNA uridine 5-carbamoylmethylation protein Kti12